MIWIEEEQKKRLNEMLSKKVSFKKPKIYNAFCRDCLNNRYLINNEAERNCEDCFLKEFNFNLKKIKKNSCNKCTSHNCKINNNNQCLINYYLEYLGKK